MRYVNIVEILEIYTTDVVKDKISPLKALKNKQKFVVFLYVIIKLITLTFNIIPSREYVSDKLTVPSFTFLSGQVIL